MMLRHALILTLLPAAAWGQTEQQLVDAYVQTWSGLARARWITYRLDPPGGEFKAGGYLSDVPREWRRSLNPGDPNANSPVDPFTYGSGGAKHVLIMVHGFGAPAFAYYHDLDMPFFTSQHDPNFHETGATAWFDNGQSPEPNKDLKLYTYLRKGAAAQGFDPNEWVILATTLNILPQAGCARSILENADRLRALMDLLWTLKSSQIRTISFASHSTGSPIVKSVLGQRTPASTQNSYLAAHPWIGYVDDHINLAGAVGGTSSVLLDPIGGNRPIGHQLLYGIQHALDYQASGNCSSGGCPTPCTITYRYTGGLSMADGTFKRSYRWPAHINVLSVAGVWDGPQPLPNNAQPFDGNPFSFTPGSDPGGTVAIPNEVVGPAPTHITMLYGKSDGIVPNRSVIERVRYNFWPYSPGPPFNHQLSWVDQVNPDTQQGLDWNSSSGSGGWRLPSLSSADGGGSFSGSSNGNNIPASDRYPGEKVTYVEVNAQHNGMLHNEHLMLAIKRRLGTFTVTPHIQSEMWVDFAWGGVQNGTFNLPYSNLNTAVTAVQSGGRVRIKTGLSSQTLTINKHVTLETYNGPVSIGSP